MLAKRVVSISAVVLTLVLAPAALAQDFDLSWWTIDGGGEMWTSGGAAEPPPCPGDLDGDDDTDQSDLGILLAAWGINDNGDLDNDGATDQSDLGILLADWGCGT